MNNEYEVTGGGLKMLRLARKQSLQSFWGEIHRSSTAGIQYESGKREMDALIKRVCYLHFVCGLNINMENPAKAAKILAQAEKISGIAAELKDMAEQLENSSLSN